MHRAPNGRGLTVDGRGYRVNRLLQGAILLTGVLVGMDSVPGEETLLQRDDQTVTLARPLEVTFRVPPGWPKVYLALEGRLRNPATTWRGGSMPCIAYLVNGRRLRAPHIVNLREATDLPTWGGAFFAWIGDHDNWRLTYSPDFEPFVNDNNPAELGDTPYRHVFDITGLVDRDAVNTLSIRHDMPHFDSFVMVFRNIALHDTFTPATTAVVPRDLPDVAGRLIEPQRRHAVDYQASLCAGGALRIDVGSDRYLVTSRFSRLGGGFNRLGSRPEGWQLELSADRLTATGSTYRLERSLTRHPECLGVRDRLTNLTAETIGVRLAHEIAVAKADLRKVYKNGLRLPRMEGTSYVNVHPAENPTVYVAREQSGLGLLPRDTVFRAHIELRLRDGAYGLHDRHFALAPGASYELRWQVFPTAVPDYYAFVNAARRSLNANYPIDGNMVIAHGYEGAMENVSDDDLRRLVHCNNAKYVVLSTISRLDEKGARLPATELGGYAHGTAFLGEHGRWTCHWLDQVIARFRRLAPDVKLLPYVDPFVCSEPGAGASYPDSVAMRADGARQLYTDRKMAVLYPTTENAYGRALEGFFDHLLEHADGFYMDESSMYHNPEAGAFSYRPDTWDGHSCQMDLGDGPDERGATYRVLRTLTSSVLYTLPYRLRQLRKAQEQGKAVWMNFQPVADEEVALQSYRFVECYASSAPVYSHLGCPVSLANEHVERSENDIGGSIRTMLMFGGLYLTYGIKYSTDGNILQDLYPFHPVELHCGYVIGKDKILTCVSGTYSLGEDSPLTVRIYNPSGFHLPARDSAGHSMAGKTVADVQLRERELAIVSRARAADR